MPNNETIRGIIILTIAGLVLDRYSGRLRELYQCLAGTLDPLLQKAHATSGKDVHGLGWPDDGDPHRLEHKRFGALTPQTSKNQINYS